MNSTTRILSAITFSLLLVIGGCVRSLHPIYTQDDLVFDEALVGTWTSDDGEHLWKFTRRGTHAYRLTFTDDEDQSANFTTRLTKIGDVMLIDFYPRKHSGEKPDFYKLHTLRTHTFARLQIDGDSCEIRFANPAWLKEHLSDQPEALKHETLGNAPVLTASTKELRSFVEKHANDKLFTTNPIVLLRDSTTLTKGGD